MKRIAECDADALYIALNNIGINVEKLDEEKITAQYLQELYLYLLHMQLLAWKAGKRHNQLIRETNQLLQEEKSVAKMSRRLQR